MNCLHEKEIIHIAKKSIQRFALTEVNTGVEERYYIFRALSLEYWLEIRVLYF